MSMRHASVRCPLGPFVVTLLAVLVLMPATSAFQPPEKTTSLQAKQFFKDDLYISSTHQRLDTPGLRQRSGDAAVDRFLQNHGSDFHFYVDPRSGTLANLIGRVPLIPGSGKGNAITLQTIAVSLGRPVAAVDAEVVGDLVRQFAVDQAELVGIDPQQLGRTRAARVTDELWHINIPQELNGIPVRHGRLAATLSHGNLVLLGTESWGNVGGLDTVPTLSAAQAASVGFLYADGERPEDKMWKKPTLEIVPYAPARHQVGETFGGPLGEGYGHRLVWSFGFRRAQEIQRWEALVDAHSGELLAFQDTNHYETEQMVGGVYPITSTEICPTPETCGTMQSGYPMPFADTGLAPPNDLTNSAGLFEYTSGTVTTQFQGPYVRVTDTCGSINESSSDGGLDLAGVNGDHDCTSSGSSPGNTPASRACFYELNKLAELGRGWLPNNTWLQSQLPATVNINQTCNANYDYVGVNFFKSGGGCRNTGEIAAVFDHEWGHGLDDNDSGGFMSSSSEAYADIASIYRLHASCVGHGFWHTNDRGCGQTADGTGFNANESQNLTHCALDCSGVRDTDWDKHEAHTPGTPQNFVCDHCYSGPGPCGRQVHCSAAPTRQAAWDFVARDLRSAPYFYDEHTAFVVGNRVFYLGSGNVGSWHACSCPSSSDGCGATNGYMQWLAADDDNGDLGDGTPHMTALYAAFNRHNIACAVPTPTIGGCAAGPTQAPVLSVSVGSNALSLQWSTVPGALTYRVFRTEGHAGCDFGKALIAEVTGTTYDDLDVANDREYSYVVQAVGSSSSCFGPVSACQSVTPLPCAGSIQLDRALYNCDDALELSVVDSDLVGVFLHDIEVYSSTETTPETVTLFESPPHSGRLSGTLITTDAPPAAGDGELSVSDGDTITATYLDASFCGTPNVEIERTAVVDCVAPVISNVRAVNVTGSQAEIRWQTDEPADSGVVYDLSTPPMAGSANDPAPVTSHTVELAGLEECSVYSYFVQSTDPAANTIVDDNAGEFHTFETGRNVNPTYGTLDPPVPIPDNDPTGAESSIVVVEDKLVLDVDVTVNITHTFTGDLELSLISPAGTAVTLSDRRGSSGNDFTDTVFDDEASTPIADGSPPFTGSFQPDGSLAAVDGEQSQGTWRLRVEDHAGIDTGTIDTWSITFTYPAQSCGPHLSYESHGMDDHCPGPGIGFGSANSIVEPGETVLLPVTLRNDGIGPTTEVSAVLTTTTPGVTVTSATAAFPNLLPGQSADNAASPFVLIVGTQVECGSVIDLQIESVCSQGSWTDEFSLLVGDAGPSCYDCEMVLPEEVDLLSWIPASASGFEWSPASMAAYYTLYRGLASDLNDLVSQRIDSCELFETAATTTGEGVALEVPASGTFHWYLIRAASSAGHGPAGDGASGPRRVNSSGACP